jgi:hypothetical protein
MTLNMRKLDLHATDADAFCRHLEVVEEAARRRDAQREEERRRVQAAAEADGAARRQAAAAQQQRVAEEQRAAQQRAQAGMRLSVNVQIDFLTGSQSAQTDSALHNRTALLSNKP